MVLYEGTRARPEVVIDRADEADVLVEMQTPYPLFAEKAVKNMAGKQSTSLVDGSNCHLQMHSFLV